MFHFFLIAIFLLILCAWWYLSEPKNLPPGPLGLPLLGSSLETWKGSSLIKKLTDWTKTYGPIYKIYVGDVLVVVLGDWNAIQEGLVKQGEAYAGRPHFRIVIPEEIGQAGLIGSEGEPWKIQRRFALSTLRDFGFGRPILEPKIKDEAEYLLEAIGKNKGKQFDVAPLLQNAISNIICQLVFGRRFQYDDKEFHYLLSLFRSRFAENDVSLLTPFVLSEYMAKILSLMPVVKRLRSFNKQVVAFIRDQIRITTERSTLKPGDEPTNYIEAYYRAEKDHESKWAFDDANLIASVGNLFVAGTDTTATTLRWAIFCMAHHPEIQEKVYEEISKETSGQSLLDFADRSKLPYTEATIMEIQRIANLVPFGVMRRTLEPTKLHGYDIPTGAVILPFLTATLWDPKVYPNPKNFDPTRFLNRDHKLEVFTHLIPFQAGKRICLGESLAKMELFIFFTALISRFKFFFSPDEPKPEFKAQPALITAPIPFKICATLRSDSD